MYIASSKEEKGEEKRSKRKYLKLADGDSTGCRTMPVNMLYAVKTSETEDVAVKDRFVLNYETLRVNVDESC